MSERDDYLASLLDSDDEVDALIQTLENGLEIEHLEDMASLSPLPKKMKVLIYGATGYTGALIAKHAVKAGMDVILAGRSLQKVSVLSMKLGGVPFRCFELEDEQQLEDALESVTVAVHCAGPFIDTYEVMVEACIRKEVHYVDINGEIPVLEAISKYDQLARDYQIMLLPGSGFDVVPSDTLAFALAKQLEDDKSFNEEAVLDFYFHYNDTGALISRGTSNVIKRGKRGVVLCRENGEIVEKHVKAAPLSERKTCHYGLFHQPLTVRMASMADVCTAFYSTGIKNTYCYMSDKAGMDQFRCLVTPFSEEASARSKSWQPIGPTEAENISGESYVYCNVRHEGKSLASGYITCPAPYKVSYLAVIHILHMIESGQFQVGFQTPSSAYGLSFMKPCGIHFQKTS